MSKSAPETSASLRALDISDASLWLGMESGPALVAIIDAKGIFIRRSREWHRILGESVETVWDLMGPEGRGALDRRIWSPAESILEPIRFRSLDLEGSKRWYELHTLASGPPTLIQLFDVTSSVKRERALRSAEQLGQLGSWAVDVVTGELTCSSGLLKIFNLPSADGLASKLNIDLFSEAFQSDEMDRLVSLVDASLRTGQSFEEEFEITVAGQRKWIRVVGSPIEVEGRILMVQGATQDISAQKHLEESAGRQRELFERTVDNIPGVVFQLLMNSDGSSEFTYISQQVESILGVDASSLTNGVNSFFDMVHPEHTTHLREVFEQANQQLHPVSCEARLSMPPEGRVRWVHVRATPRREAAGHTAWDGILLDISNEKEIESELKMARMEAMHATRLATIGEMAGSIAHEINTPLGAILLSAQTIHKRIHEGVPGSTFEPQIQLIEKTVERISRIVSSLRRLSRGQDMEEPHLIPVKEIVDNALALCLQQITLRSIDLRVESFPEELYVNCREAQITQVLMNLLGNARDAHIANDGRGTSDQELPWIQLSIVQEKEWIQFFVRDNGPGIDKKLQNRVFEPFYTTKGPQNGTGLGLSISRKIIDSHGGELALTSLRGPTEFRICLPRFYVSGQKSKNSAEPEVAS